MYRTPPLCYSRLPSRTRRDAFVALPIAQRWHYSRNDDILCFFRCSGTWLPFFLSNARPPFFLANVSFSLSLLSIWKTRLRFVSFFGIRASCWSQFNRQPPCVNRFEIDLFLLFSLSLSLSLEYLKESRRDIDHGWAFSHVIWEFKTAVWRKCNPK